MHITNIHFGALLIENTKEYNRDSVPSGANNIPLNLTGPLFIGGVPQGVNLHPKVTQRNGFSGCLKDYRYSSSSWTKVLNLTNPTVQRNVGQGCASNALAGFGLNSTSWVKFGKSLLACFFVCFRYIGSTYYIFVCVLFLFFSQHEHEYKLARYSAGFQNIISSRNYFTFNKQ